MLLEMPPNNVNLALFYVSCLLKFRTINPQAEIDALLKTYLVGPFASTFFPATSTMPSWYVGGTIQRQVVLIDGVTNASMATAFFGGYLPPLLLQFGGQDQFWLQGARDVVLAGLSTSHIFASEWLDFVGYSAGGGVATLLKAHFVAQQSTTKSKVITFGAPRAGGAELRDALTRSAIARWMTSADPIPLMPPRIQDTPTLAILFGVPTIVRFSNFSHTAGGIQVNDDGTTEAVGVPTDAVVNPGSSVATWIFGVESDPANPHSLNAYFAALSAAVALSPQPAQQDKKEAPAEEADPPRTREVNRQRQRVETAISNASERQNAIESSVQPSVLFKAIKLGKVWSVSFGEKVIVYSGNRKRAFHLAKAGNDFLRAMPKQAFVDPQGITDQLLDFFDAAVVPGGPVNPPISISL